jgi:ATP-dependent DNA helicase RecQ
MAASIRVTASNVLRHVFGYDSFRDGQFAIIEHVTRGGNALVLMPTGGGKSLCYQLPALLRRGTAVVVSPLIALMKDQVDSLQQVGVAAAVLNSSLSPAAMQDTERKLVAGELDLLYIAPERLAKAATRTLLERSQLALLAIDEAHCVSRWGHDFRPDYLALKDVINRFADVPRIALTATADASTRADIVQQLQLADAYQHVASFDRPNICYNVLDKANAKKQIHNFVQREHPQGAGIVYCLSRKRTEDTAAYLQARGINAQPYHAGLPASTRDAHQQQFLHGDIQVMTATIAFGMGIDKPDVRFVAHLDLPKNLEGYYQETGRAGRDGAPASTLLTYGLQDAVSLRRLLAQSSADDAFKRVETQKLEALLGYCESVQCRRQVLLAYFGETLANPCGNCDTCVSPPETWDATVAAQMLLSCIYRSGQRFGAGHVIDILLGKDSKRMLELGHNTLSTFGIGSEHSATTWRMLLRSLVATGYITTDADGYGVLKLTPQSAGVLKGNTPILARQVITPKKARATSQGVSGASAARQVTTLDPTLDAGQTTLWTALKALRTNFARTQQVPPYVIFRDLTLREMIEAMPTHFDDMRKITGIGEVKLERYGQAFLDVLNEHRNERRNEHKPEHEVGSDTTTSAKITSPKKVSTNIASPKLTSAHSDELVERLLPANGDGPADTTTLFRERHHDEYVVSKYAVSEYAVSEYITDTQQVDREDSDDQHVDATYVDASADALGDTLNLIYAGYSVQEVASKLALTVKQVQTHCLELVRRGHLTAREATGLPTQAIDAIEQVVFGLAETGRVSPKQVYAQLNKHYSLYEIRCVVAALEQ